MKSAHQTASIMIYVIITKLELNVKIQKLEMKFNLRLFLATGMPWLKNKDLYSVKYYTSYCINLNLFLTDM